jgi:uncharacterized protein
VKSDVVLDTGPIVAALSRRDGHHRWAVGELSRIAPPLVTCDAVITEACFLLREMRGGRKRLLDLVQRGLIKSAFDLEPNAAIISGLMDRYSNLGMSFADACLVLLCEERDGRSILTLDGGFRHFRRRDRRVIPTIMPRA